MKQATRVFSALLLALLLGACQSNRLSEACASLLASSGVQSVNDELKITVPSSVNSLRQGDTVYLAVDNYSRFVIEIAPDRDLQIYSWQAGAWTDMHIPQNALGRVDRIGVKTDLDPGGELYILDLEKLKSQEPLAVCVLATGVLDPDGGRQRVGASIEFQLRP